MIAPPKLQPGDRVALLAPARWPTQAHIDGLVEALTRHGLVPVPHPQLYDKTVLADGRFGQLPGNDAQRAAAFNETLADPSIRAIFFPRAGAGSHRILDLIDYDLARRNPKIIVGFSDVDILLAAISQRSGVITFRGPLGVNFSTATMDPRTERDCFEVLEGRRTTWRWTGAEVLREGTAEGGLVGGNLATLNSNIGTPFEVDTEGNIVVVEECDELVFRLDRFLYQMARAGKFAKAKAVLFGTIENMLDGEQHDGSGNPFGKTVPEMLLDYVPPHVPLVHGLPLGHGAYLSTHPIGANVRVEITKDAVEMHALEPMVV